MRRPIVHCATFGRCVLPNVCALTLSSMFDTFFEGFARRSFFFQLLFPLPLSVVAWASNLSIELLACALACLRHRAPRDEE